MELEILRQAGLTDGEIRVYDALLSLGRSSTGQIMKKAQISSSKVYLILDKLIHKGLVSFVIQNNVRYFQAANPRALLEYLETKKEELDKTKERIKDLIPFITARLKDEQEESAQVYKGMKGVSVAYTNVLQELSKGEEYCLFAVSPQEIQSEKVINFFANFHKKRVQQGVFVRAIADTRVEKFYKEMNIFGKLSSIKHHALTFPSGIVIGKNRVLMVLFGNEDTAYEIVSTTLTQRYKVFFNELWKKAKE